MVCKHECPRAAFETTRVLPVALPEACWHAITSLGLSPASVILSKLDKNKRRTWPTTPDEEGVYEAIDAKDEDEK